MRFLLAILLCAISLSAQFASSVSYGKGCRGAILKVDAPKIGNHIFATIPSHPIGAFQTILLGVSLVEQNQSVGNGCTLLIYPMWNWIHPIPHTHRGPNGIYMGQIVDDPGLIGLVFFVQAAYRDIDLISAWTNGVKCTVGY